ARHFVAGKVLPFEIVDAAAMAIFERERNTEVEIEIVAGGRGPRKLPTHAELIGFGFCKGSPRDRREAHVAFSEMRQHAVEMIGEIGATRAALDPIGTEHEVIDDQLAPPCE